MSTEQPAPRDPGQGLADAVDAWAAYIEVNPSDFSRRRAAEALRTAVRAYRHATRDRGEKRFAREAVVEWVVRHAAPTDLSWIAGQLVGHSMVHNLNTALNNPSNRAQRRTRKKNP